ncbi:unnamed protein product [Brassica napus]|uniref:(rape) hypothetical protein n=1 Tax=Brassica napus TaxID=3708 RepID=A0A816YQA3_BRANA|nr:unnamed protein product [Brassica napus]
MGFQTFVKLTSFSTFKKSLKKLISSFLLIFSPTTIVNLSEPPSVRYKSIISFGDSSADTGNFLSLSYDINHPPQAAFLPYGETFFHPPSRRYFDGRLIIDFIAEFLGLPYVPPYFGSKSVSFDQWVNFAVYGATALDRALLVEKGIKSDFTNVSLRVQLNIFKKIFPNLCASSSHCREVFGDSLILTGEIGVNDYNYPFSEGKSLNEIKELVPLVIKAISSASVELIDLGGKTFLVPGNFPLGCFQQLTRLQKLYPHVSIIYADYYNSMYPFFQEPAKYGRIDLNLAACCGVGGQYNFTIDEECGSKGVSYCQNPSECVNWDGYHLTEAAHLKMDHGLLNGPYVIRLVLP